MMLTHYRREDLVSAAEYVLDDYVLEGLDEYEVAVYDVRHMRRRTVDKWVIFYRKVIRGSLRSVPVCRMVIGPHARDLGALSVTRISLFYPELEPDENAELMDLTERCCKELVEAVLARAHSLFCDNPTRRQGDAETRRWGDAETRRPTVNTRVRAETFKRLKDAHPEWGYDTVAMRAAEELRDPRITGNTVRNAYRTMGWRWERADRVR